MQQRRQSRSHLFEDRLAAEKARLEAALANMPLGPDRICSLRKSARWKRHPTLTNGFRCASCSLPADGQLAQLQGPRKDTAKRLIHNPALKAVLGTWQPISMAGVAGANDVTRDAGSRRR